MMIEKLLQLLVHEINPQLLERVSLNHAILLNFYQSSYSDVENLESRNVKDTNVKGGVFQIGPQSLVDSLDEPSEHPRVDSL